MRALRDEWRAHWNRSTPGFAREDRRLLVALFCLGLIFKGTFALGAVAISYIPFEADFYDDLARNLLAGNGYVIVPGETPNLWRAPLYPAFLAGVWFLTGSWYPAPVVVQVILEAVTGIILFRIGLTLFGRRAAILAGVAWALYPISAFYASRLMTESLFTCLFAVCMAMLLAAQRRDRSTTFFAAGVLLGLAVLVRPSVQQFPLAIAMTLLARRAAVVRPFACVVAGMALAIAPWMTRNYLLSGHLLPVAAGSGYNLWLGNHLPTDGRDTDELPADEARKLEAEITAIIGPQERIFTPEGDRIFLAEFRREIAAHPAATLGLMARKVWRFWFNPFQLRHRWAEPGIVVVQSIIIALAAVGFFKAFRAGRDVHLLFFMVLYFMGVYAATVATLRYSVPLMPYLFLLGGYALAGSATRGSV